MTHHEQITVYRYTKTADGYGGYTAGSPVEQTDAPTWATIDPVSGNDVDISLRLATESVFDVEVNYRSDFTWLRDMFIVTRFGNLDVISIREGVRKRTVELQASLIEGFVGSGGGGGVVGGLLTVYKRGVYGDTDIVVTEGINKDLVLFFRDGIGKKVVTTTPTVFDEVQWTKSSGTLTLFSGDIFGQNELLTFLFK